MPPRDSDAPDDPTPDDATTASDASEADDAARPERLLATVQDAALERALLDGGDAPRHLALAGGLERARRAAVEGGYPGQAGPFGSALLAVATLAAFDAGVGDAPDVAAGGSCPPNPRRHPASPEADSPWRPTVLAEADGTPDDAVVEGAALAVRRFDADVRRAAALADVPVATLGRRLDSPPERR